MGSTVRLFGFVIASVLVQSLRAAAGELHIYEHNKSVIHWYVVGDAIKATYSAPRPGLAEAGVRRGATLFEGGYEGGRIVGKAYAFKSGCAPAGYDVIGAEKDGIIILKGPAPTRSPNSCEVTGFSATSPHAQLILIYSATHH